MSTISDRICPKCQDKGFLSHQNFCGTCGAQLEMKGTLRSAAETILPAFAIGVGVQGGVELVRHAIHGDGSNVAEEAFKGLTNFFDS